MIKFIFQAWHSARFSHLHQASSPVMSRILSRRLRSRTSGCVLFDKDEKALRSKSRQALAVEGLCCLYQSLMLCASTVIKSSAGTLPGIFAVGICQSGGISNSVGGTISTGNSIIGESGASDRL